MVNERRPGQDSMNEDVTSIDEEMPLRLTNDDSSLGSRLPSQTFSMALGITVKNPDHPYNTSVTTTTKKKVTYIIIRTNLLIPGDGDPIPNAALVIENTLIVWLGPIPDLPTKYTANPHRAYTVPYLMPGLWDVHIHCTGGSPSGEDGPGYTGFISTHPASAGARLARGLWEALQRGYTSIRDVAGVGAEVSKAVRDGEIVGPNIYAVGACLSQTAGHGDVFNLPAGVVYQNLGVAQVHDAGHFATGVSCIVDGVDECRRAVRLQIRRGARCIKVLASGGVMSRDDDVTRAQFSNEELAVIVEEAARQGRSVAAHVHGKSAIIAAVRAGVRTVEHLSFADQECVDLIKEKDVICVPTRTVMELLLATHGVGLDPNSWEKAKLAASHALEAYQLAIKKGCTIAMGTDTAPGMNHAVELEFAVQAGLSSLEAIKAATVNGALTVGEQAPKTGQLKVGYEADVIGLTANPVEDVRVLQNKGNVKFVWKGGKIYKGPGVSPWGEDAWWGDSDPWKTSAN